MQKTRTDGTKMDMTKMDGKRNTVIKLGPPGGTALGRLIQKAGSPTSIGLTNGAKAKVPGTMVGRSTLRPAHMAGSGTSTKVVVGSSMMEYVQSVERLEVG